MNETLLQAALNTLEKNWNGAFTLPAPGPGPHQRAWDESFIAIGSAHYNLERAEAGLRRLFKAQWADGRLPHIVFGEDPGPDPWRARHSPNAPKAFRTSDITTPPACGFALWRIYEIAEDKKRAAAFLREMYPKVVKWHRYLYQHRDPQEEGLVYICHPWETGAGDSPTWDGILERADEYRLEGQANEPRQPQAAGHSSGQGDDFLLDFLSRSNYDSQAIYEQCPFLIQDPFFNGLLAWSNECLIQIGGMLGEDVSEIIQWDELTKYSMNEKLWDEERGIYNAYDLRNEELVPIHTISGLLPLCGDVPTQEQAEKMLLTLESGMFGGKRDDIYLCPTYSLFAGDVDFEKPGRGPVSLALNWLLYHGLLRYDMEDSAARARRHSLELLEKCGFFEYFSPREREAERGIGEMKYCSATAAICLDLIHQ